MPLDFENTNVAFSAKTDGALRRSFLLYRMLSFPTLVKAGQAVIKGALALHLPIESIIRRTVFLQFCGGETIEECQPTIQALARFGIGTVLDYSVEGAHTEVSFKNTTDEILRTVDFASKNHDIAFCVFKVSGVAPLGVLEKKTRQLALTESEKQQWERARERVASICSRAHASQVKVFIDAEESWIQGGIDILAEEMMARFNKEEPLIYNTLQMYRTDRLAYLRNVLEIARKEKFFLGFKLVRGAYMEKERARAAALGMISPIYDDKKGTDQAYNDALELCGKHLDRVALCAGTHNEKSTALAAALAEKNPQALTDKRIYFCQLLGMGDYLSYNLANEGYPVAKYVPYGPVRSVMPYLFRRAEENTSIQGQTGRELSLIEKEWARRKKAKQPALQAAERRGPS